MKVLKTIGLAAVAALAAGAFEVRDTATRLYSNDRDITVDVLDTNVTALRCAVTDSDITELETTTTSARSSGCERPTSTALKCNQPQVRDEVGRRDISLT